MLVSLSIDSDYCLLLNLHSSVWIQRAVALPQRDAALRPLGGERGAVEGHADQGPRPLQRQRLADQQWVFQAHQDHIYVAR
jgi:hypothetical protein